MKNPANPQDSVRVVLNGKVRTMSRAQATSAAAKKMGVRLLDTEAPQPPPPATPTAERPAGPSPSPQATGQTFVEFITQRTGFGRTSWPEFVAILSAAIVLLATGAKSLPEAWAVVPIAFGIGIPGMLILKTWHNYTGRTR